MFNSYPANYLKKVTNPEAHLFLGLFVFSDSL